MQDFPNAPKRMALFLDFDGTLVDIAERPEAVIVPPHLPALLERLSRRLDGGLAVVSGRPIEQLDHFLPVPVIKAGNHGAALRRHADAPVEVSTLPSPPAAWRTRARALTDAFPGTFIEDKSHSFVVHFRQAPEAAALAGEVLAALVAEDPHGFVLLPAHMAFEVTPRGVSKGTVVKTLMADPRFAGRMPVFVGDDVTDEAGMAVAREAGGLGWRLQDAFGSPGAFRDWLAALDTDLQKGLAA